MFLCVSSRGQGEDTEESVSMTKPRKKTSTTAPGEASLTQKTPTKKKLTVPIFSIFLIISAIKVNKYNEYY